MDHYLWNINHPATIKQILQANVGGTLESPTFKISNLSWKAELCPNGTSSENEGVSCVYIQLLNLSKAWKSVTARITIECQQTCASNSFIFKFTKDRNEPGWKRNCLLLSELQQLNPSQISFKITVQIIEIISRADKQCIFYDSIPVQSKQQIEWKIDPFMLQQFESAHTGKIFESKINENDMFVIQCYPQGIDDRFKGKMSLYLQLIHLSSPNVHRMKVKYTLSCNKIKFSETKKFSIFHNNDEGFWGIAAIGTLKKLLAAKGSVQWMYMNAKLHKSTHNLTQTKKEKMVLCQS